MPTFNFYGPLVALLFSISIVSCNQQKSVTISGSIDYVGSANMYISQQPIHYKYSDKIRHAVIPESNGKFQLSIPADSLQLVDLYIDDQSYPLLLRPGNSLTLTINRAEFPDSITVEGYQKDWNQQYINYHKSEEQLLQQIDQELQDFREGESTKIISLYEKRVQLAKRYFEGSPFENLYFQAIGEYLVKRLENIQYQRKKDGFNPEKERQEVLDTATELNFFSFKSLHAQRAGIRDFTNAFANTFGVADSLEQELGRSLMQYDVKRLGYKTLDSARTSVLASIKGKRATAYAKMHLIAERIGEMPLDTAQSSYQQFVNEYSDFPKYVSFLTSFYEEIKSVAPGQPAVPFALPNEEERIVQLQDFRGRYVLLDFWASWCIPCLDEFPPMKEIYNRYSRDKFEIVAISIEKDSLRWRQSIKQFNNPWPQLYGGKGFQQSTFAKYRGGGIPFYILVAPDGTIERYNDVRPSFNLPTILDSLITQQPK